MTVPVSGLVGRRNISCRSLRVLVERTNFCARSGLFFSRRINRATPKSTPCSSLDLNFLGPKMQSSVLECKCRHYPLKTDMCYIRGVKNKMDRFLGSMLALSLFFENYIYRADSILGVLFLVPIQAGQCVSSPYPKDKLAV